MPDFQAIVTLMYRVAQPLGKGPQFAEFVLVSLAFVFGRDTGVDGSSHKPCFYLPTRDLSESNSLLSDSISGVSKRDSVAL